MVILHARPVQIAVRVNIVLPGAPAVFVRRFPGQDQDLLLRSLIHFTSRLLQVLNVRQLQKKVHGVRAMQRRGSIAGSMRSDFFNIYFSLTPSTSVGNKYQNHLRTVKPELNV